MMRDCLVPKLDAHLASFDAPFAWGERDCVTLAAGWVKLATGRDLVPPGLVWSDAEGARAALRSLGCADTRELASRFLEPRELVQARVGDIVGREFSALGFTLGICTGADGMFLHVRAGLIAFSLLSCAACWSVD